MAMAEQHRRPSPQAGGRPQTPLRRQEPQIRQPARPFRHQSTRCAPPTPWRSSRADSPDSSTRYPPYSHAPLFLLAHLPLTSLLLSPLAPPPTSGGQHAGSPWPPPAAISSTPPSDRPAAPGAQGQSDTPPPTHDHASCIATPATFSSPRPALAYLPTLTDRAAALLLLPILLSDVDHAVLRLQPEVRRWVPAQQRMVSTTYHLSTLPPPSVGLADQ